MDASSDARSRRTRVCAAARIDFDKESGLIVLTPQDERDIVAFMKLLD